MLRHLDPDTVAMHSSCENLFIFLIFPTPIISASILHSSFQQPRSFFKVSRDTGEKPLPHAEGEAKDVYFRCAPAWEEFLALQVLHHRDDLFVYHDLGCTPQQA
jgi:hypothetical protein